MNRKILVTYASQYGATREIAEKMGLVLRRTDLQVDVAPVEEVRDLTPYQAVIVGSGVYIGQWNKSAERFLTTHEESLAGKKVWLFSSGPTGSGDPIELLEGWRLPAGLQPVVDRIHPRDIAVFHGNIDPSKINPVQRWVIKSILKKPFGDYRDWNMIINWTNSVASAMEAM